MIRRRIPILVRFLLAASAAAILIAPAPARCADGGQQAGTKPGPETTPPEPGEETTAHRLTASWDDEGLTLRSDDGDYRFRLGAFVRFDARMAPDDPAHVTTDTLLMRLLRVTFEGQLTRYFMYKLAPDFTGGGSPAISDAFIDIKVSDKAHIRAGRDKTPIGFEVLQQDSNVLFLERGLTSNVLPSRDVGLQVYGALVGGAVTYDVGVFNGMMDGANTNNPDTDSAKDLVGRIVIHPIRREVAPVFAGLGIAFGGSRGRESGPLPSYKSSLQQVFFTYDPSAAADGIRTRVSPQLFYYYKSLGIYSELVRSTQAVTRDTVRADVANTAWQAAASYLITGETSGEKVRPRRSYDPERHRWGALQVAARVAGLRVDSAAFDLGLAGPNASRQAAAVAAGVNWYLSVNVKAMFNVERTVFDGDPGGVRYAEHAVLCRLQLNY